MKENVVSGFLGQGVWKVQLAEVYRHLGEPICDFRPIFCIDLLGACVCNFDQHGRDFPEWW